MAFGIAPRGLLPYVLAMMECLPDSTFITQGAELASQLLPNTGGPGPWESVHLYVSPLLKIFWRLRYWNSFQS